MDAEEIGKRLLQALKKENLSLRKFSSLIGKTPGTISNWASGKVSIPIDCLTDVCNILHCNPQWLLFGNFSGEELNLDLNRIKIPEYSISFSAGNGCEPTFDEMEDVSSAFYPREFFNKYNVNYKNCKRFRVSGDSMEPLINDGDIILVDCSPVESIKDNEIYAISINGALRVKQLVKPLKGGLIVRSFNSSLYKDETFSVEEAEQIKVIGRVVDRYGVLLKPIR